jgi:hypothetical protein
MYPRTMSFTVDGTGVGEKGNKMDEKKEEGGKG